MDTDSISMNAEAQRTQRRVEQNFSTIFRRNPPPTPAGGPFHPVHACASGRKGLTIGHRITDAHGFIWQLAPKEDSRIKVGVTFVLRNLMRF